MNDEIFAFGDSTFDILRRTEGTLYSKAEPGDGGEEFVAELGIPDEGLLGIIEPSFARWVQQHAVIKSSAGISSEVFAIGIRSEDQAAAI